MTGRDWRVVGKFALICAIGGPLLGVAVFWWLPLVLVSLLSGSFGDLYLATGWLVTNVVILLPGNAPPAAALGALGTWLLLRRRTRGQGQRGLRFSGMVYGAVAGIVMSLLAMAQGQPYSAHGGGLALLVGAVQPGSTWEPMIHLIGNLAAGGGTGVLLGLFVAALVGRQTGPEPTLHGARG
jgi:hypothetical protein